MSWRRRALRLLQACALGAAVAMVGLLVSFYAVPLPERLSVGGSSVVTYRDGRAAHVFLAEDDRWRIPVGIEGVDPGYIEALLRLEDKRFWTHPGIDPVAVVRAAGLNLSRGRVVSGASTITMQVVRVVEPRPRTLSSKIIETYRALQLEFFLSKEEILAAYLDFAPYGRNIEGVEAASLAYFGHSASALSAAEIATLLAVPQNPTARYPRPEHADRLRASRDDIAAFLLLEEALSLGGSAQTTPDDLLAQVKETPVPDRLRAFPREIPHLAVWLRARHPGALRVASTIDASVQRVVEDKVAGSRRSLRRRGIHNGAVVVIDHQTGQVVGLAGNLDWGDGAHGGQIPMFDVPRSPGSALKPFIYASAIDAGHVVPERLVPDVPATFGAYSPKNYDGSFAGLIRVEEALSRSLNLPFVFLLRDIGIDGFIAQLEQAGVQSLSTEPGYYGLSVAAGGIELTPLEVAGLYAGLAGGGSARVPQLVDPEQVDDASPVWSEGASYLTRRALSLRDRPDFPSRRSLAAVPPAIHWKTGTSFGHRDAWAAGSGPRYTAAVWLGNADASPSRSLVGAEAAGPLLFDVLEGLSSRDASVPDEVPEDLTRVAVCTYSGHLATEACPHHHEVLARRTAVPSDVCPYHRKIAVDVATGEAVSPECRGSREVADEVFLVWPPSVRRFLSETHRRLPESPRFARGCGQAMTSQPVIVSPASGHVALLIPGLGAGRQDIPLEADSSRVGGRLAWFVNGQFIGKAPASERVWWTPRVGRHEVVVIDESGGLARRTFEVRTRG